MGIVEGVGMCQMRLIQIRIQSGRLPLPLRRSTSKTRKSCWAALTQLLLLLCLLGLAAFTRQGLALTSPVPKHKQAQPQVQAQAQAQAQAQVVEAKKVPRRHENENENEHAMDKDDDEVIDRGSLDEQQRTAYDAVLRGENIFITGGAGTGKTRTLQAVVQATQQKYGEDFWEKVAVTGSTGTAAVLLGGSTLHSATGVRVPFYVSDFNRVCQGVYKKIWQNIEVLLLDEASMISGEFFDHLEKQMRRCRQSEEPFGGIQVVLVGDVYQLPPILSAIRGDVRMDDKRGMVTELTPKGRSQKEIFTNRGMLFQSEAFWKLQPVIIELSVPHRQSDDQFLAKLLNQLRAEPTSEAVKDLNDNCLSPFDQKAPDTVTLMSRKVQADLTNAERLSQLPGDAAVFQAQDSVEVVAQIPENLTKAEGVEYIDGVRKALQQMMQKDGSWPVGSVVELKEGALVILCKTTDSGRGLVNGLTGTVVGVRDSGVYVHFEGEDCPFFVGASEFESIVPGLGRCVRQQLPLRLAWAITHHRSQGKTLPRVDVDPRSFAAGQAYVALSRAKSLDTLRLICPAELHDFKVSDASRRFTQLLEALKRGESPVPDRHIHIQQHGGGDGDVHCCGVKVGLDVKTALEAVGHWQVLPLPGRLGPDDVVGFGKHRGLTLEQLSSQQRGYCRWLLKLRTKSERIVQIQRWLRAASRTRTIRTTRSRIQG